MSFAFRKIISLFLFFPLISFGQDNKKEAIIAFKDIVKTYYDKDCKKYYDFWDDSVSTLNKDSNWRYPSHLLIGKKRLDCTNFGEGAIKETKTFKNYLSNYDIQAVSYEEFKNSDRKTLLKKWDTIQGTNGGWDLMYITIFNKYYRAGDVLVIGDIPKKDAPYIGLSYVYLLRKTKKGWKIIGVQY